MPELLCTKKTMLASLVYPLILKLTKVNLADDDNDSVIISQFKRDLRAALVDMFALDKTRTAQHPFVTATVLDPATKACDLFEPGMRAAAYDHVRQLSQTQATDAARPSTSAAAADDEVGLSPNVILNSFGLFSPLKQGSMSSVTLVCLCLYTR